MSKQQLLAYPYVSELEYRGRIDSHKMNLMLRSIEESVLRAILRGSESQETFEDLNLAVLSSYLGMMSANNQFMFLQGIANMAGTGFATSFETADIGGRTDLVAGITTLDWDINRQYTKIPRYDTDNDGIADQVSPSVVMLVDGVVRPAEDKAYNCLNRNNKSFWIETTTPVEHTIEIQLPPSINKKFNYIEVVPMPIFGLKIKSIVYQDPLSNDQTIYDSNSKQYIMYKDSGPIVMHLEPKETNGTFKIVVDVNDKINAMGFSSVEIALIDYKDEEQTAYLKFPNIKNAQTLNFTSISFDFYVDGETTTNYDEHITGLAITNKPDPATETAVPIPAISHDAVDLTGLSLTLADGEYAYLKVTMKENNMTTPVIRGCQLTYEVV